jgi:pilus assembly protein CpaB
MLAVLFGLGAMMLTRQMLAPGDPKRQEETQEVLVAARDFKEEERIKPEMTKVVRMAKSLVPPGSFSSIKDIEDRWVKTTMLEDDVILEKKLGTKGTPPGLVANIPKGMRAFAIDVTEQSGVSGFILPGHRVDVVRYEGNEKSPVRGETILQNVLVLAAGQVFTRPDEKSVQSRTVTLALTPDEVDILAAARAKGTLSLSLRGVDDHDLVARQKDKSAFELAEKEKADKERAAKEKADHERRLKVEEERRTKLEKELLELKQALLAKKDVPPPPKPAATVKIATIYRGINNRERILVDKPGVSELEPDLEARQSSGRSRASGVLGSPVTVADEQGDETDL